MTGKVLLMERAPGEVRLAVLEDGKLCELYSERAGSAGLTGNIYAGRVENVVRGMNAAFVDIGLKRNGFLSLDDAPPELRGRLRPGQMLPVQVEREGAGSKGPRLKCQLSIAGRCSVLLPDFRYAGVSKKIEDAAERDRLFGIASRLCEAHGSGMIARTEAEGAPRAEIEADYLRLLADWRRIEAEVNHASAPRLIRADADLALKAVRDMLSEDVERIRTDDAGLYAELRAHALALAPELAERIELVACETPLFDLMRVDHQLDEALSRRVNLKSGGNLVIDETEALTVIDVNSAKFTGKREARETILRLNCEAAEEIARQLRLRDVGGIVIVDFIDMEDAEDREALLARFREAVARDSNRVNVLGVTALGLVELTRKRERLSLLRQWTRDCSACGGSGREWSYESVAHRAARELWRRRRMGDSSAYRIVAGERVAQKLRALDLRALGPVRVEAGGDGGGFEICIDEETELKI